MPSSFVEGKQTIANWLTEIQPTKILDIGPGCGTYSFVLRGQYGAMTEGWPKGKDSLEKFIDYKGPEFKIIGIEAYYPYIKQFSLNLSYDKIIVADARYVNWGKLSLMTMGFDVALCGDVLEHMSVEESMEVFRGAQSCSENLIMSIPIVPFPQGDIGGNPFETHVVEDWTFDKVVHTFGPPYKHFKGDYIGAFWYR